MTQSVTVDRLWAVREGRVTHYVRPEDLSRGLLGLAGPTLCGKMPAETTGARKHRRIAAITSKTCNTCAGLALRVPSRIEWR